MAYFHSIHCAWRDCRADRYVQALLKWFWVIALVGFVIAQQARHQRQIAEIELAARSCVAVAKEQSRLLDWFLSGSD